MLDKIFLLILNMSFIASFVILFVLIARLFLRKSPMVFSYALWGVVLFRLICPFSFESMFSFLPAKVNPISQDIVYANVPKIDTSIPTINRAVNSSLPAATPHASVNPLQVWVFLGSIIWLTGIVVLLIYSIVSLMKLKKRLKSVMHERDNIYLAEKLDTPFVMGIIRPKIYLPTVLAAEEKQYILLHEQTHIRRFDHVIKILSFFVLCLHWFNPLVWIAFFISGRDMEMSCDEAVIKQLGNNVKKEYSSSLLVLATGRRIISGTPLAFGEGDTRSRIKNVLNYKKPTFWVVVVITVIAVVTMGVGLITNPINSVRLLDAKTVHFLPENLDEAIYGTLTAGDKVMDFSAVKVPEFADFIKELKVDKTEVTSSGDPERDSINQIHLVYEGFGNDGTVYNVYFNFNADFTKVWVDNDVKPSSSYRVKKPEEVKSFFEMQLGSVTQIVESGSVEELWKARTKYIGDNSAVGNIIGILQFPKGVVYNSFELHTRERPYAVTVNLKTNTEIRNYYSGADNQSPFQINALIMFSLIENAEYINFDLDDGIYQPYSIQYTNDMAKMILGENYFKESVTLEGFHAQLEKIRGYGKSNEIENTLTFWVKPDEPLKVIGEVAAEQWLSSYKGDDVPETERIAAYTINSVTILAVDMAASDDVMYDYIVNVHYGITTATESYLAPGDGISGKGTFAGLFRELYVKDLGRGNFEIVFLGTGGSEQESTKKP